MARWTAADIPPQHGRTAVVTGGNAGLGEQIALGLARAGARVVLACRSTAKADAAASRITAAVPGVDVDVVELDLADLSSVKKAADRLRENESRLDLLVNNAGLMAVDESRTVDGFETQLGVNHLGHFALTAHLLPLLEATDGSRVGSMSSMGHRASRGIVLDDLMFTRRGYDRWQAYFASKLANLYFTSELDRRLRAAGSPTTAVAAHPGGSRTDLGSEGRSLSNRLSSMLAGALAMPPATGALGMLRALTAPDVTGGQYYGPRFLAVGHPVLETPSRTARDAMAARGLWEASVALTGVEPTPGRAA